MPTSQPRSVLHQLYHLHLPNPLKERLMFNSNTHATTVMSRLPRYEVIMADNDTSSHPPSSRQLPQSHDAHPARHQASPLERIQCTVVQTESLLHLSHPSLACATEPTMSRKGNPQVWLAHTKVRCSASCSVFDEGLRLRHCLVLLSCSLVAMRWLEKRLWGDGNYRDYAGTETENAFIETGCGCGCGVIGIVKGLLKMMNEDDAKC